MRINAIFILCLCVLSAHSQKPIIDSTVFNRWSKTGGAELSRDGNYGVFYILRPQQSPTVIVSATQKKWKKEFSNIKGGALLADNKWFVFQTEQDSLCLLRLGSDEVKFLAHVNSYEVLRGQAGEWLTYPLEGSSTLIVRRTGDDNVQKLDAVTRYWFNATSNALVIRRQKYEERTSELHWLNLSTGGSRMIWQGNVYNYECVFDQAGRQLAIYSSTTPPRQDPRFTLWLCRDGEQARQLMNDGKYGVNENLVLDRETPIFNQQGDKLFVSLIEQSMQKPASSSVQVDVWSYRDKRLAEEQLGILKRRKRFMACVDIATGKLTQLEDDQLRLTSRSSLREHNDQVLLTLNDGHDFWWQKETQYSFYITSLADGQRKLVKEKIPFGKLWTVPRAIRMSPGDKYIVYYDPVLRDYISYDIASGKVRNITAGLGVDWKDNRAEPNRSVDPAVNPVGIAGWTPDDRHVLLYDNWDIWKIDLTGVTPPLNITNSFGNKHHIRLRLTTSQGEGDEKVVQDNAPILLSAFDTATKYSGYFSTSLNGSGNPRLLAMGPYRYELITKATSADEWVVKRESAVDAPNFFVTRNFKDFSVMTDVNPQRAYNWLQADVVTWNLPDGKPCQGMLFRPENFDSTKKYPLFIDYYDVQSDELYRYREPAASMADINIPYFVSRGYIVFYPDIHHQTATVQENLLQTVTSATDYLVGKSWIDSNRMGLLGHSFGGYETNYLVTHTKRYAAAKESCGSTDMVSGYGGLLGDISRQEKYELGQYKIGANLWDHPERYIDASPVLRADQVTTPLLMMHNKQDALVPWTQGVEFFMALRRLGKRAWMLQYDKGEHFVQGNDALDYTTRIEQFFDHYLKGAPPPLWMTEGVPASEKGLASKLELDSTGKIP